ncbi:MAG: YciI family protein [Paracoccus sp. (in: a-proteobacteria)]|uniref:YciI family protein n=1 Tax=Paracoccus sp. TaxID=267 RepID=UPI00391BA006
MGFFLMRCLHHPGMAERRDALRAEHRVWVGSGGRGLVSVLIGSALLGEDGDSIGNFGILEARSIGDARRFAEGDPFAAAGIVRDIDITPLPDGFQAARITDPMSPRLQGIADAG